MTFKVRLGLFPTVLERLLNISLKDGRVSRALEHETKRYHLRHIQVVSDIVDYDGI